MRILSLFYKGVYIIVFAFRYRDKAYEIAGFVEHGIFSFGVVGKKRRSSYKAPSSGGFERIYARLRSAYSNASARNYGSRTFKAWDFYTFVESA